MVELSILRLFARDKAIYTRYIDSIYKVTKEPEIKNLFNLISKYYSCFTEHEYISRDELLTLYRSEYPLHKTADKELHERLITNLFELEVSREMATELIHQLIEKDYANTIAQLLLPVALGHSRGDHFDQVITLVEEYNATIGSEVVSEEESPFYEDSLEDILDQTEADGLSWRLQCLRTGLGPLTGGTLGHVFARPEVGKTSFLHSEVTFLAPQMENGDLILWFNNEEAAGKVKGRWYCAMAGMTTDELRANKKKAEEIFASNGGSRLKLVDEANLSVEYIEKLCKEYKPRLVVIDQGDKVSFSGDDKSGTNANRLKGVYDRLREVVKRCNKEWKIDILTVGQADAQAEGKKRLYQKNLDEGKTGKAGAFDYIIGIGAEQDNESVRYISFCKNKLKGYHGIHMVTLDRFKGRYSD